ncbi:MAG: hypothetical protein V1844_14635 [Pseudomonadota bacterium]
MKTIRRNWHNDEWWFSVIDIVGVLSDSDIPKRYWSDLKRKLVLEAGSEQPYERIVRLKLQVGGGCNEQDQEKNNGTRNW